jgi:hypothetical protein
MPPETPPEDEDDGVLSITIGDDVADADAELEADLDAAAEAGLGDAAKRALKRLREVAAEKSKQARELEARLARIENDTRVAETPALERPTFENCGFDEEVYAKKMEAYTLAKAESAKEEARQEEIRRQTQEDYTTRVQRYTDAKKTLQVPNYDEVEDVVRKSLNTQQQSIIIRNIAEPEKLIYALGRSKKALAELAATTDLDRFAFKIAKMEGAMVVTKKSPPPVESKLRGGSSATVTTGNLNAQLEAAEKEADRTGDRSRVVAIKRQIREAQA